MALPQTVLDRLKLLTDLAFGSPGDTLPQTILKGPSAAPSADRTIRLPDPGADAFLFASTSAQAVAGQLTRADLTAETAAQYAIRMQEWMNIDGTVMDATGAAGKFKRVMPAFGSVTGGISINGEDANNNTKTDDMACTFELPPEYVAGSAISFKINSQITGGGTLGATKTLTLDAFLVADGGAGGSNLGPTAVTLVTGSTLQSFAITPTGLVAGSRLLIQIRAAVQETAATAIRIVLSNPRIVTTIKG